MELFLKHFINYEYPRTNEEGNKLFSSENLPNFGKEQWNEMIKENLENDIKKIGKDVEKKMDYLV